MILQSELLIISDLLKVSYHNSEDHNSNVNFELIKASMLLLYPKFDIKFQKCQVHQHFPWYINEYSQVLEHN